MPDESPVPLTFDEAISVKGTYASSSTQHQTLVGQLPILSYPTLDSTSVSKSDNVPLEFKYIENEEKDLVCCIRSLKPGSQPEDLIYAYDMYLAWRYLLIEHNKPPIYLLFWIHTHFKMLILDHLDRHCWVSA